MPRTQRSKLLTVSEKKKITPALGPTKHLFTHVSSHVTETWQWYNEGQGVVQWNYKNDDTVPHTIVNLRNGYYFGGAFWPVYYANSNGRGASATNPADNFGVDWATALDPLKDNGVLNNAPPIGIVDFGSGKRTVNFLFTIEPESTWSMLEGGFSALMTPSGLSAYEVALEKSAQFCVGYDPTRVSDWDTQTGTSFQGYSPNPNAFDIAEVTIETDAPFDVLPFTDSIVDGPCTGTTPPPPPPPPSPQQCISDIVIGIEDLVAGQTDQGLQEIANGIQCLFATGVLNIEKSMKIGRMFISEAEKRLGESNRLTREIELKLEEIARKLHL